MAYVSMFVYLLMFGIRYEQVEERLNVWSTMKAKITLHMMFSLFN